MKPLVSVVIPSYNYAHYICNAIDSVLSQDHENVEVIVTDNRSTDDTMKVLERYAGEPRFRLNVNERNLGIPGNINVGIGLARGEYVVILSADDWLLPGHTSRLVSVAEQHPEIGFVYATAYLCKEDGSPYAVRHVAGQTFLGYSGGREELGWLLTACYMCFPTILFRRSLFERYGRLDESYEVASDWEITTRLVAAGTQVAYVAAPLVCVRIHESQASGRAYLKSGLELSEHLRIFERYAEGTFDRWHGREKKIAKPITGRYTAMHSMAPESITGELTQRSQTVISRLDRDRKKRSSRNPPSVAVIVTSMGRLTSLGGCLKSLGWQTYPNWHVWVLQDQGFEIYGFAAQQVDRKRLRYCRTPERFGAPLLRSQALVLASADYYLFIDEDTQLAPRHLEELVSAAERGEGVGVAGTIVQFNMTDAAGWQPQGNTDSTYPLRPNVDDLLVSNCLPLSAVLFDCAAADELDDFDTSLGVCADWDFIIRLSQLRQFSYTGTRTLVEHAFLGLNTQMLQTNWNSYLPCMDALYQRHTVPGLDVLKARELHRADVVAALQHGPAAYGSVQALFHLYSVLSGSARTAETVAAPV